MSKTLKGNIKNISLLKSSIPYLAQTLVGTIAAPINTFISSGINAHSMEGVGTASSILFMFGVLSTLLSGGASIVIGHFIGNDSSEKELKRAVDTAFWMNLVQGIFLFVLMIVAGRYLLIAWGMGENTESYKIGVRYIDVLAPLFIASAIIGYFIQTTAVFGVPKISMFVGVVSTTVDAGLSAIFVYCTDMGVDAVIFGTLIARMIALAIALIGYHINVQKIWKIRGFDKSFAKKIARISLPIAGEKINYNASRFVQGIIIGNIAASIGLVIAGHNVMLQERAIFTSVQSIVLIGGVAISIALEPIVSRALGKKMYDEAKLVVRKAWFISIAIDIPLATLVCVLSPYIVELMSSKQDNQLVIEELKKGLRWAFAILIVLEIGRATNLVYIAATRSAGDAKYTAYMSVIVTWLTILLAWVLARYSGLNYAGIVIAAAADECGRALVNFFRWKSNKWKKYIDKIHEKEEKVERFV